MGNPLSDDLGLNTASRPSNTSDAHEASAIKRRTLSAETSRNCFHTLLTMPGAEVVKLTNSLRRGTPSAEILEAEAEEETSERALIAEMSHFAMMEAMREEEEGEEEEEEEDDMDEE